MTPITSLWSETGDEEMLAAVSAVTEMDGGLVAVADGEVLASLPLPVAGLLSESHMQEVAEGIAECIDAAHKLGCDLEDPFMTLSFLSLPVIPELKLTDRGWWMQWPSGWFSLPGRIPGG